MKTKPPLFIVILALLSSGFGQDADAAGKEGEWVRIPSKWLLHRFVRPSTAPAHTHRVALIVPPGANKAKVAKPSGNSAMDRLEADYAATQP